ncbi:hypothetical protein GIB67_005798, partial [Kingdonia uniflora]
MVDVNDVLSTTKNDSSINIEVLPITHSGTNVEGGPVANPPPQNEDAPGNCHAEVESGVYPRDSGLLIYWKEHRTKYIIDGLVVQAGLGHLGKIAYEYHNGSLVTAFVERWDRETSSFHFNFGEMTILLEDVVKLVRLTVKGKSLPGIGLPKSAMKVFCDLLGLTDEEFIKAKSTIRAQIIRMQWRQEDFEKEVKKEEKKKDRKGKSVRSNPTMLQEIREALNNYSVNDVVFDPFEDSRENGAYVALVSWFTGLLCCPDYIVPIYPGRSVRQLRRVQRVQGVPQNSSFTPIVPLGKTENHHYKVMSEWMDNFSNGKWENNLLKNTKDAPALR